MGTIAVQRGKRSADAVFSLFNLSGPSQTIEQRLRRLKGVKEVTVDYVSNNVLVRFDPDQLTSNHIRDFLRRTG